MPEARSRSSGVGHPAGDVIGTALLQITIILLAARAGGWLSARFGQARILGELLAGIALGPSVVGAFAPAAFALVFASPATQAVSVASQIGVILFMFEMGMHVDLRFFKPGKSGLVVLAPTLGGTAISFLLGCMVGVLSVNALTPGGNPLRYALFIGTAFSITALPVLASILHDLGLLQHKIGKIGIAAAAISDIIGSLLLSFVVAFGTAHFDARVDLAQVLGIAAFVALLWILLRALLPHSADAQANSSTIALVLPIVFAASFGMYRLGASFLLGAAVVGCALHDHLEFRRVWDERYAALVSAFFLPLYFAVTGIHTNLHMLLAPQLFGWCLAVILVATFGKLGVGAILARLCGLHIRQSIALGVMLNTRGLVELIVVNAGYDAGVIPQSVYTILIVMTIVSTLLTTPLLRRLLPLPLESIDAHRPLSAHQLQHQPT